ncbi:MAG TPA: cytochrome c-type biogenesis protein CcmH [Microthrixaceae bacterium]|nr:cytochrome c-type biogenesis protein CcmH [Microthrixaceae bacterium]
MTARRGIWILVGVAVVVLLAVGTRREPTGGNSDDRLFAIAGDMKCLQCVGENVANSQAAIAVQMREEIRRQMAAGRTDDEIFTYFADRYGPRVLLNPAGSGLASLVWVVPVLVVGLGLLGVGMVFTRSRRSATAATATADDLELVERARRVQHDPDTDTALGSDLG